MILSELIKPLVIRKEPFSVIMVIPPGRRCFLRLLLERQRRANMFIIIPGRVLTMTEFTGMTYAQSDGKITYFRKVVIWKMK